MVMNWKKLIETFENSKLPAKAYGIAMKDNYSIYSIAEDNGYYYLECIDSDTFISWSELIEKIKVSIPESKLSNDVLLKNEWMFWLSYVSQISDNVLEFWDDYTIDEE